MNCFQLEVALTVDAVAVLTTALTDLWKNDELRPLVFPFRHRRIDYGMNCSTAFQPGPYILDAIKRVCRITVLFKRPVLAVCHRNKHIC